jgi:type II secretory pathway pseudopilin PulG
MKKQQSFSLVEVLVASAIFAMVLMVVMTLVGNLSSVSLGVKSQQNAISSSQFVMDRITKDIMMADNYQMVPNPPNPITTYYGFLLTDSRNPNVSGSITNGNCSVLNAVCDDFVDDASNPKGIIILTSGEIRFYYLDTDKKIYYAKLLNNLTPDPGVPRVNLTPDLEVNSFNVIGSSKFGTQPWAKIMISYQAKSGFFKTSKTTYNLETMATVRKSTW